MEFWGDIISMTKKMGHEDEKRKEKGMRCSGERGRETQRVDRVSFRRKERDVGELWKGRLEE